MTNARNEAAMMTDSSAFRNLPGWGGLGKVVTSDAPTPGEMIREAGLDWTVSKNTLTTETGTGAYVKLPNHVALVRNDTNTVLGVVSPSYEEYQNAEAFDWLSPLVASDPGENNGRLVLESAGCTHGGRKLWIQAKTNLVGEVLPGDSVRAYWLFTADHGGSGGVKVVSVTDRLLCSNQINRMVRDAQKAGRHTAHGLSMSVRHSKNMRETLERVRGMMDIERGQFVESVENMKALTRKSVTDAQFKAYAQNVYLSSAKLKEDPNALPRQWSRIEAVWQGDAPGQDLPGVRGTAWGAMNAVTFMTTHESLSRGTKDQNVVAERRAESNTFGDGAKTRARATELAFAL